MADYPCGVYRITGRFRFSATPYDPSDGNLFDTTINAFSVHVSPGGSSDEVYVDYLNCNKVQNGVNNGVSGVRASTLSITKVGECPCTNIPDKCGCIGTWKIGYQTTSSQIYYPTYTDGELNTITQEEFTASDGIVYIGARFSCSGRLEGLDRKEYNTRIVSTSFTKTDPNCVSSGGGGGGTTVKHDCINGQCVPSTRFSTPGIYNSLDDCKVQCELNNTDLVCLTPSEFSQISRQIAHIKNSTC